MSVLRNAGRELRGIAQFGDSSILPNSALAGLGVGGGILTTAGALAISTVYNCAKVLVSDISILPFLAYSGDKHGVKQPLANQPLIVTDPFGPNLSAKAGIMQIVASLALRGRAFLYVSQTDPRTGFPTQVQVLNPDQVQVKFDQVTGYKYFVINGAHYTTDEIKHIMGMSMPGAIDAADPITYMRTTLGMASDRMAYGAAFFRQGTSPSGVISVQGQGDRRKAREVKEAWESGHSGVANAHRPAVLFNGATWSPLAITPENAQFLQTGQFLREDICGWLGVPLQRISSTPNGNAPAGKGLDTIDQGYATHTLLPLTTTIEDVWDSMIPGGLKSWCQFNYGGLLRANAMERAQISQIHRLTGIRNRNEIRADEGWAPIEGPDGTNYNVPFNTNTTLPVIPDLNDPAIDDSPIDQGGT